MIFATGRKSLCGYSRPFLQLFGGAGGVHTEGLNYLSSLNEVGDMGRGSRSPERSNGWPRATQHTLGAKAGCPPLGLRPRECKLMSAKAAGGGQTQEAWPLACRTQTFPDACSLHWGVAGVQQP